MLARKVNIAYPIILVVGGLIVSFIPHMPAISIDPEIIFVIFLPPLLYEAAWGTSWKEFWKWRRVISSFAFLIVIVTALVVALVSARFIPGFTLALGFLLGGIVSPPDAVSASTILKNIKVPRRMIAIVEGESLLNDAASLIVFRFALIAINTGTFVLHEAAGSFFIVIILGIAVGLGIGLIFYAIHRWLPTTANMDILLTFVEPYIMYIVAERFHVSGVLAVVSGGLFLRSRSYTIMGSRSRFRGEQVWSTIAFALNGFIFLLIGLELPVIIRDLGPGGLPFAIKCGLFISLLLIVLRLLCTLGASAFTVFISRFITTADSRPGWKAPLIFGWAGMRGVVSLAAALSIPLFLRDGTPFPYRNLILFITFSVIIVTLVLQGLTLPALVRWLNMPEPDYQRSPKEQEIILRKKMSMRALDVMHQRYGELYRNNCWVLSLESGLKSDVSMLGQIKFPPLNPGNGIAVPEADGAKEAVSISYADYRMVSLDLVQAQRQLLHELNKKEELDERIIRKYQTLLDLEEERVVRQFGEEEGF